MQEEGKTNQFADVTLVSDELIPFRVNKFVLSANSPMMKEIFLGNPHDNPSIYLKGYNKLELKSVLELIYFGETIFDIERIELLVKIIEEFHLTGFEIPIKNLNDRRSREKKKYNSKVPRKSKDVDIFGDKIGSKKDVIYECNYCDYKSNKSWSVRTHQESRHEGVRYECDLCDYKATDISNLRKHQRRIHKCNQCEFKASQKSEIVEHQRRQHNI